MVKMQKPDGIFILDKNSYDLIYNKNQRQKINNRVKIVSEQITAESIFQNLHLLSNVKYIFSGWGGPELNTEFLSAAPLLEVVFYGAGSIRGIVTDESWERGVRITSAYAANGVPVVEFTLAQIFLCLKKAYQQAAMYKQKKIWYRLPVPGSYHSTVGIISLGMIGQMLAEQLLKFDVEVIAYDPFLKTEQARKLRVEMVSLEEVFQRSDVVTLHTPWLPETEGMITGRYFQMMKQNASFINTARGAVVNEQEMIRELQDRPDLFAVLDVTHPEPPLEDSLLYSLPNVFLTPHIAGSMDRECQRMGQVMVDELRLYMAGKPMRYEIFSEQAKTLA